MELEATLTVQRIAALYVPTAHVSVEMFRYKTERKRPVCVFILQLLSIDVFP